MGNTCSVRKANYSTVQNTIQDSNCVIISTLPLTRQDCLITGTISASTETSLINTLLKKSTNTRIIVYGENAADDTASKKCCQLVSLGFKDIQVYSGGLFEWLLLQDIYGEDNFPTTSRQLDILSYAGAPGQGATALALIHP